MSHNKSTLCVTRIIACVLLGIAGVGLTASAANRQDDQKALAKLDADYQKAVEQNDTKAWETG